MSSSFPSYNHPILYSRTPSFLKFLLKINDLQTFLDRYHNQEVFRIVYNCLAIIFFFLELRGLEINRKHHTCQKFLRFLTSHRIIDNEVCIPVHVFICVI